MLYEALVGGGGGGGCGGGMQVDSYTDEELLEVFSMINNFHAGTITS